MNRLTIIRLFSSYSLTALALFTLNNTLFADLDLPKETSVSIDSEEIQGYRIRPERLKEIVQAITDPSLSDEEKPFLPQEGFIYFEEVGLKELYSVSAWSAKGREARILKVAKAEIEKMIQSSKTADNSEPSGYVYFGEKSEEYGNKKEKLNETAPDMSKKLVVQVQSSEPEIRTNPNEIKRVLAGQGLQLANIGTLEPQIVQRHESILSQFWWAWLATLTSFVLALSLGKRKLSRK